LIRCGTEPLAQVYPDMELGTILERYEKLRSMIKPDLYMVQDLTQSTK
jgi:hypothetical protein